MQPPQEGSRDEQFNHPSRAQLVALLKQLLLNESHAHSADHAFDVEKVAISLARISDADISKDDILVLSTASLLHDVGRAERSDAWSPDELEHVTEGAMIARTTLASIEPFATNPLLIDAACYLIYHHDDTNYSFPTLTRGGRPGLPSLDAGSSEWTIRDPRLLTRASLLLSLLQDADARSGSGKVGVARTLEFSLSRGVPPFAEGNPLNDWLWEECAVGNARLAMKRALLDASSAHSLDHAIRLYMEGEEGIQEFCERNGVPYVRPPDSYFIALRDLVGRKTKSDVELTRVRTWTDLLRELRAVPLRGDETLFPYSAARVHSVLHQIDSLRPLSRYIVKAKVAFQRALRQAMLSRYALDLFDLSGIVDLRFAGEVKPRAVSPPIIEVYEETVGSRTGEVHAVVDGTHRLAHATNEGVAAVRVAALHGLPDRFPLIALPLSWEETRHVDQVPDTAFKRLYRFATLDTFPDTSHMSRTVVTQQNFTYFFYRLLDRLGSSGIRPAGSG